MVQIIGCDFNLWSRYKQRFNALPSGLCGFSVLLIILLLISGVGSACICGEDSEFDPNDPLAEPKRHTVFLGRVEMIKFINAYDYVAKVKVLKMWKSRGNAFLNDKFIYLGSTLSDQECGMELILGHRYLVYADYVNGMLVVDRCGKTKPIRTGGAQDEMRDLGSPAHEYEDNLYD